MPTHKDAETVMRKNKPHVRYYAEVDGKKIRVPGTTTIVGVLDKPALKYWANKMGLSGIDIRLYVDEKADIGTCAHYLIETELKGEVADLSEFAPAAVSQAENGYLKFLEWRDERRFKFLASEIPLVSTEHLYGGTIDIYCEINGIPTLVDIKTSGLGIYPEMELQATAYVHLLRENGYPCDQAYIVRVGRDENEGFDDRKISKMDQRWELFKLCRQVYELQKALGK